MVNPFNETNYPAVTIATLRLVCNLGKMIKAKTHAERLDLFEEGTANIQALCALCGWRFNDLVLLGEADWSGERDTLICVAMLCGIIAEACARSLKEEEITAIQIEVAVIWVEMRAIVEQDN